MPDYEPFTDTSVEPPVRGFLHDQGSSATDALIMTHGAGGNCRGTLLTTLAEAFATQNFKVLRCELPFRQSRSFGPPRPGDAARDRSGLRNAVGAMRNLSTGRVFLGGQSYGGRQASMLCAEHAGLVNGMLLLSYPLHAPGKLDQLRTQHFPDLKISALFVQGTSDPFGSIEEMRSALKLIPAPTSLVPVEGEGHDLGFKGKKRRDDLAPMIVSKFQGFFGS